MEIVWSPFEKNSTDRSISATVIPTASTDLTIWAMAEDDQRSKANASERKTLTLTLSLKGRGKTPWTSCRDSLLRPNFILSPFYFILSIRCSPTRSALAMIVSAGFTAPLEQKMLPSTT